ncbi:heterogeneous nuclear ribonucleoprotein A0-like [Oryzias melastigma]|uniref:Heterogeneous nuclear ribonucleoprotein A0-like n=1 Tax=Oryzias melastigma TaxID=30732 RepID=A0A3B3E199_ORYME|nr:heterogeneous nuclear ribonucleoprotein A0-like [Oryzias melastigma]
MTQDLKNQQPNNPTTQKPSNPKMTGHPNKLFVGGLSANTDDDGLRQHFERFGELIDHVVIKHKVQSRSRCFGFVIYAKPEQADAAMAARPHTVDGTAVEVKRAVAKEKSKEPESFARAMEKKIFVGGLKNDIFEFQLTEYFSQYGQVEKSEIMVDLETRQNRGFGFVHFTDPSAADKAAFVKFHTVNGHQVEVKKALTKQEIKGEGGPTPRVMGGNQNDYTSRDYPRNNSNGAYGGSHGAVYSHQGNRDSGIGFNDNEGYGGSHTVNVNMTEVKQAYEKTQCNKPEPLANAMGRKIFVGGLKNDIFEFHLTQYFSQYGQVDKSEILVDMVTGRNRGFGFVHFTDPSAADKAALVKFHKVNGHRVEVKKALTKQEMQGEDGTTPRVMGGNQNGYGGSHGAGYYDQGSSYGGHYSYGNNARFYDNGGYSGTYTCGHCGHENPSGGWNVYNGYGQCYSGYGPNNAYFSGQSTAPYTGGW